MIQFRLCCAVADNQYLLTVHQGIGYFGEIGLGVMGVSRADGSGLVVNMTFVSRGEDVLLADIVFSELEQPGLTMVNPDNGMKVVSHFLLQWKAPSARRVPGYPTERATFRLPLRKKSPTNDRDHSLR